jgi:YD repeat-containing protein
MWSSVASEALRAGKRLELRYDGWARVVEVHTVGILTSGNAGMSVYQVRGGSNSDERVGWKLMLFDKSFTAHMIDEESEAPRAGYKRGARPFQHIVCQL